MDKKIGIGKMIKLVILLYTLVSCVKVDDGGEIPRPLDENEEIGYSSKLTLSEDQRLSEVLESIKEKK